MDTSTDHGTAPICSVTEMATKLGLSRARFYQLVEMAVFPPPVRVVGRRPFYPPDLQQKCLQIRRTRVGFNGLPVLFNRRRRNSRPRSRSSARYDGLVAALTNMGLKVNADAVRQAVRVLYPAGPAESEDELLRDLFQYFAKDCQNSV